jgi:hypothetical protein
MKQQWMNSDRAVVLEMMEFLLRNEIGLKKRAYLAPYLTPIEVPQDFKADESTYLWFYIL